MSEPDWTTHILAGAAWRRFGIMILLVPILGCVGFFIAFTALFQFFSVLANGETTPSLRRCGEDLGRYATAIIDFLTYNSDRRPFPFAASVATDHKATPGAVAKKPAGAAVKKKPATRKTGTRKRSTTKKTSTSKKARTSKSTTSSDEPSQ